MNFANRDSYHSFTSSGFNLESFRKTFHGWSTDQYLKTANELSSSLCRFDDMNMAYYNLYIGTRYHLPTTLTPNIVFSSDKSLVSGVEKSILALSFARLTSPLHDFPLFFSQSLETYLTNNDGRPLDIHAILVADGVYLNPDTKKAADTKLPPHDMTDDENNETYIDMSDTVTYSTIPLCDDLTCSCHTTPQTSYLSHLQHLASQSTRFLPPLPLSLHPPALKRQLLTYTWYPTLSYLGAICGFAVNHPTDLVNITQDGVQMKIQQPRMRGGVTLDQYLSERWRRVMITEDCSQQNGSCRCHLPPSPSEQCTCGDPSCQMNIEYYDRVHQYELRVLQFLQCDECKINLKSTGEILLQQQSGGEGRRPISIFEDILPRNENQSPHDGHGDDDDDNATREPSTPVTLKDDTVSAKTFAKQSLLCHHIQEQLDQHIFNNAVCYCDVDFSHNSPHFCCCPDCFQPCDECDEDPSCIQENQPSEAYRPTGHIQPQGETPLQADARTNTSQTSDADIPLEQDIYLAPWDIDALLDEQQNETTPDLDPKLAALFNNAEPFKIDTSKILADIALDADLKSNQEKDSGDVDSTFHHSHRSHNNEEQQVEDIIYTSPTTNALHNTNNNSNNDNNENSQLHEADVDTAFKNIEESNALLLNNMLLTDELNDSVTNISPIMSPSTRTDHIKSLLNDPSPDGLPRFTSSPPFSSHKPSVALSIIPSREGSGHSETNTSNLIEMSTDASISPPYGQELYDSLGDELVKEIYSTPSPLPESSSTPLLPHGEEMITTTIATTVEHTTSLPTSSPTSPSSSVNETADFPASTVTLQTSPSPHQQQDAQPDTLSYGGDLELILGMSSPSQSDAPSHADSLSAALSDHSDGSGQHPHITPSGGHGSRHPPLSRIEMLILQHQERPMSEHDEDDDEDHGVDSDGGHQDKEDDDEDDEDDDDDDLDHDKHTKESNAIDTTTLQQPQQSSQSQQQQQQQSHALIDDELAPLPTNVSFNRLPIDKRMEIVRTKVKQLITFLPSVTKIFDTINNRSNSNSSANGSNTSQLDDQLTLPTPPQTPSATTVTTSQYAVTITPDQPTILYSFSSMLYMVKQRPMQLYGSIPMLSTRIVNINPTIHTSRDPWIAFSSFARKRATNTRFKELYGFDIDAILLLNIDQDDADIISDLPPLIDIHPSTDAFLGYDNNSNMNHHHDDDTSDIMSNDLDLYRSVEAERERLAKAGLGRVVPVFYSPVSDLRNRFFDAAYGCGDYKHIRADCTCALLKQDLQSSSASSALGGDHDDRHQPCECVSGQEFRINDFIHRVALERSVSDDIIRDICFRLSDDSFTVCPTYSLPHINTIIRHYGKTPDKDHMSPFDMTLIGNQRRIPKKYRGKKDIPQPIGKHAEDRLEQGLDIDEEHGEDLYPDEEPLYVAATPRAVLRYTVYIKCKQQRLTANQAAERWLHVVTLCNNKKLIHEECGKLAARNTPHELLPLFQYIESMVNSYLHLYSNRYLNRTIRSLGLLNWLHKYARRSRTGSPLLLA